MGRLTLKFLHSPRHICSFSSNCSLEILECRQLVDLLLSAASRVFAVKYAMALSSAVTGESLLHNSGIFLVDWMTSCNCNQFLRLNFMNFLVMLFDKRSLGPGWKMARSAESNGLDIELILPYNLKILLIVHSWVKLLFFGNIRWCQCRSGKVDQ